MNSTRYRGFISYSHGSDAQLAVALQQSLSRIARPWYRLRTMRIFLDKASLSANPALWPTIEEALSQSEYLLLLASPGSAQSQWVQQEIGWWIKNRSTNKLILCLTDGSIVWDARSGDFDWTKTNAIPQILKAAYSAEPLYADFCTAKAADRYVDSEPSYRNALLDVAAPLMGKAKDDLDGDDIRAHRRMEVVASAAGLIIVLLIALVGIGLKAAHERQKIALSRALASEAMTHADDGSLALLLSIESGRVTETVESRRSLLSAIQRLPFVEAYLWGHTDAVTKAIFSPDGQTVLSAGWDDRIIVWSVRTHQAVGEPISTAKGLVSVAFNADGSKFASTSGGSVICWNTKTRLPIGAPFSANESFVHVGFSHDGKLLAATTDAYGAHPSAVYLWDIASHRQVGEPIEGANFAFNPDDSMLAIAHYGDLAIYDLHTHRALHQPVEGHSKNISAIAFSPDGRTVATGSEDKSILLWDVATRKPVGKLAGNAQTVSKLLFSLDGRSLYSGSTDGTILRWDLENEQPTATQVKTVGPSISDLMLLSNGEMMALGLEKERAILLHVNEDPPLGRRMDVAGSGSANVAFSPDGTLLASAGDFGEIVLTDAFSGAQSGEPLSGHERQVSSLVFTPDSKTLVSGSMDGAIIFWDIASHKSLGPAEKAFRSPVWSLACSPDAKTVVGGGDSELLYWDLKTRKRIGEPITSQKDRIWSLAFNPHGDLLASMGNDLQVSLWKEDNQVRPMKTVGPSTQNQDFEIMPAGVTFNAAGTLMAASSPSHSVTLWNVNDWRMIAPVLYGHTQAVSGVAFAPDGKVLASGSADGAIRLWDVTSHESIGTLSLRPEEIKSIAFAPDGKVLASVDVKDAIVRWSADLPDWVSRACALANRDLTAKEWSTYFGTKPYQKTCTNR